MTTTPAPARLHAVTREVEPGGDLLDDFDPGGFAWLHHQTRLVATGVAARLAPDDVDAALAAIDADDPLGLPGTGAIAVGALPFDPDAPGELVIPARIVGEVDGRAWVTEIGASGVDPHRPSAPDADSRWSHRALRAEAPRWSRRSTPSRGELEKVVLAREVLVEADTPFDARDVLRRLVARNNRVASSMRPTGWSARARSCSCAAPAPRSSPGRSRAPPSPTTTTRCARSRTRPKTTASTTSSSKAIADALGRVCHDLEVGMVPDVAVFGPVAHLATPIRGQLIDPAPSALELARLLHPTPAVGGTPRAAALAAIRALEGFDRGRYAGPVGWVDARGNGEWAIALRCAELDGSRARLVAGAGIVDGSDPDAEWAETQAKLEPMLRALVRP